MREEVKWFAEQMENKFQENDNKGKRKECDPLRLVDRLKDKRMDLWLTVANEENENTVKECVEVANLAMVIADKARKRQLKI